MKPDPTATAAAHPERALRIVAVLRLACSPIRRDILLILAAGDRAVGDIGRELPCPSQSSLSHQLALLRHGGLVEARRDGRRALYRLTDSGRSFLAAIEALAGGDRAGRPRG